MSYSNFKVFYTAIAELKIIDCCSYLDMFCSTFKIKFDSIKNSPKIYAIQWNTL